MPKREPELLECLWFGDGSWYDVDDKHTHVVNEGGNGPHLLVRYDNPADPNDKEAVPPDQVLPRLRCRSRAIQDSECKGLRVGAKVVALYVLSEQERLYYDACVVDVERKEHGTDDCDCTCQFTCEWMKPPPFLPPSVAVRVPTGKFVADIGGLCAIGSLGHLHPKVKQWMAEIERLQRGKTRSTASPATSASKAETTSFVPTAATSQLVPTAATSQLVPTAATSQLVPTAATSQLVATSASIPKENITTTSFTQAATLTQASHNQSESAAAPPVLNSIVHPAAVARATLTDNEIGIGKQSGVESHKARRAILSQDKTDTPGSAGQQAISLHDKTDTPGSAGQQAISLQDKTDTPGSAGQQAISLHDKTDTPGSAGQQAISLPEASATFQSAVAVEKVAALQRVEQAVAVASARESIPVLLGDVGIKKKDTQCEGLLILSSSEKAGDGASSGQPGVPPTAISSRTEAKDTEQLPCCEIRSEMDLFQHTQQVSNTHSAQHPQQLLGSRQLMQTPENTVINHQAEASKSSSPCGAEPLTENGARQHSTGLGHMDPPQLKVVGLTSGLAKNSVYCTSHTPPAAAGSQPVLPTAQTGHLMQALSQAGRPQSIGSPVKPSHLMQHDSSVVTEPWHKKQPEKALQVTMPKPLQAAPSAPSDAGQVQKKTDPNPQTLKSQVAQFLAGARTMIKNNSESSCPIPPSPTLSHQNAVLKSSYNQKHPHDDLKLVNNQKHQLVASAATLPPRSASPRLQQLAAVAAAAAAAEGMMAPAPSTAVVSKIDDKNGGEGGDASAVSNWNLESRITLNRVSLTIRELDSIVNLVQKGDLELSYVSTCDFIKSLAGSSGSSFLILTS